MRETSRIAALRWSEARTHRGVPGARERSRTSLACGRPFGRTSRDTGRGRNARGIRGDGTIQERIRRADHHQEAGSMTSGTYMCNCDQSAPRVRGRLSRIQGWRGGSKASARPLSSRASSMTSVSTCYIHRQGNVPFATSPVKAGQKSTVRATYCPGGTVHIWQGNEAAGEPRGACPGLAAASSNQNLIRRGWRDRPGLRGRRGRRP